MVVLVKPDNEAAVEMLQQVLLITVGQEEVAADTVVPADAMMVMQVEAVAMSIQQVQPLIIQVVAY